MNIGGVPQSRLPQRQSVKAGGGDATTVSTVAPAQAQPAQPTQPTGQVQAASVLTSILNGIMNLFKGFFSFLGNLFHGASTTTTSTTSTTPSAPTPGTGTPATPTANGLDAQSAAIAQQYGLLPTAANVQAFVTETQGYAAANSGVLGAGSTNVQGVRDLQTALAKLGYPVQVNGQYDQATMMAVKSFKQANGMHQSYQMADGSYGVNEYADVSTQAVIKTKAGQVGATQPTSPTQTTQSTVPANWQAMATQYHLLPTQDNVGTFMAEVQAYQQEGALGPGTPNTQAVTDLQNALAKLGYHVAANGQYDAATQQAVLAFKTANGLHQTYKAADGNFAINEYADSQTLQLLMSKLQAQVAGQPAQPAQPTQPVQTPPAPVQTPAQQPAAGLQGPWDLPAGQRDYYAIQQTYHVYGDPANMDAFCNEMKSYESNGALGPASTNTQAITDLQGALARLGYQVPQSGHYDQATMQAVMAFKQANGIHQSYKGLDGNFAINEFAETQTLQAIMQKLQAQVAGQPAQPVQAPAQPVQQPASPAPQPAAPVQQPAQQPAQGATNTAAIAAQYHIQDSADNVNAFLNEVKQYQTDGALGPGSNQTQAINDLQTVLAKFGFQVKATGQFDAATQQAVIAFKKANGLHQSYKATDGNFAVNEYADKQTLELIMTKLQQQMNKAS